MSPPSGSTASCGSELLEGLIRDVESSGASHPEINETGDALLSNRMMSPLVTPVLTRKMSADLKECL